MTNKAETPASRKQRAETPREVAPRHQAQAQTKPIHLDSPAAGAHAAHHLINEEATPGAGALPSHAHRSGKEVDGGAG